MASDIFSHCNVMLLQLLWSVPAVKLTSTFLLVAAPKKLKNCIHRNGSIAELSP